MDADDPRSDLPRDQDGRPNGTEAYDSIRRSLERLQVSQVDLVQLHSVGAFDDLDRCTASGGALEGAIRARDEGLVAAIGITGHGMKAPAVHLEALRRYRFDTVLTPNNYRLTRYPEFLHDFEALVEEVRAQDAGLMFKAVARNLWRAGEEHRFDTWYEPLEEQSAIDAAMAFALGRREATGICTAGDARLIPMQIEAEGCAASIRSRKPPPPSSGCPPSNRRSCAARAGSRPNGSNLCWGAELNHQPQ